MAEAGERLAFTDACPLKSEPVNRNCHFQVFFSDLWSPATIRACQEQAEVLSKRDLQGGWHHADGDGDVDGDDSNNEEEDFPVKSYDQISFLAAFPNVITM